MDYKNGKIYAIRSYQTDMIYIGSTCSPLNKRMWDHRAKYKQYLKKKYKYITSFEILKYGDAYIELIQEISCKNILELRKWEGNYIRNMNCVNKYIPQRTKEEYYKDNKENIKKTSYNNYHNNKELISLKNKKTMDCICGSTFRRVAKARHNKSLKHRTYMFNLHNELNHLE